MKKFVKPFIAVFAAVVVATLSVACDGNGGGKTNGNHECSQKCPVCGYCLDLECYEDACWDKCGDLLLYDASYVATHANVARKNVTVVPEDDCVTDFALSDNSSISFNAVASKAETITLMVTVGKTSAADVYTDVTDVYVNGEKLTRPTVVPVFDAEDDSDRFAEICLGCVDVNEGNNIFKFIAKGDDEHSHDFKKFTIIGDARYTLVHSCNSECDECGGCKNFSCFEPECSVKCECDGGAPGKVFSVIDDRVEKNRDVNRQLDGIGCTWGRETLIKYYITSAEAEEVTLGAVVSHAGKKVKFTDQFTVKVNGEKIVGDGEIEASTTGEIEWNEYDIVVIGKVRLQRGRNEIIISQIPVTEQNGGNGCAYNFQSAVIFGNGVYDWYSAHTNFVKHNARPHTCTEYGSMEYYTCACHPDVYWQDSVGSISVTEEELRIAPSHEYANELTVENAKIQYNEGETFDTGAIAVKLECVNCSDGELTFEAGEFTVDKDGPLTRNDSAVTVSCVVGGKTYTKTIAIFVYHVHELGELVPAVDATCTEEGTVAYYECDICGKRFEDDEATTELDSIVSEKLGHALDGASDNCVRCGKSMLATFGTDRMVDRTRAPGKDGMGCAWGSETRFTYNITASEAGEVTIYVWLSRGNVENKFTDMYKTYINGELYDGTGMVDAYDSIYFTSYDRIEVGKVMLHEGVNTFTFSFTPIQNVTSAHNFLKMEILGVGDYT